MTYSQLMTKILLVIASIITCYSLPLNSAIALQNAPENLTRNFLLAQTTNNKSKYQQLIKTLILQNKPKAALKISERSRNRAFIDLLTQKLPTKTIDSISTEQIKQVAKIQNPTLVQYSLLNEDTQESELVMWVIKPTGEITMRRVDLKAWQQKSKTSLAELITKARNQIGVRSDYNNGFLSKPQQKS